MFDLYRNAAIKSFELSLKLLPQHLQDVRQLAQAIQAVFDAAA